MNNEKVEPMVVDKKGNIYISMQEYNKDMDKIKENIKKIRKNLLHTKNVMKKLYNAKKNEKEGIKALGYIEAVKYLEKYLLDLLR